MKKNMGTIDRSIRIIAAIAIGILIYAKIISGTPAIILGILAGIFLLTSFISFCPLYAPFKLSTRRQK